MILIYEVFSFLKYTQGFNESTTMNNLKQYEHDRQLTMDDLEVVD